MKGYLFNKYKTLLICLFLLTNYSFSQNWLSLTTHNVTDYLNSKGYNFVEKKTLKKNGNIVYSGSKKYPSGSNIFLEIIFENGIPYAKVFTSSSTVKSSTKSGMEGLDEDFMARYLFLELKNDLIDNYIRNKNFSILNDNDKLYETDWKKGIYVKKIQEPRSKKSF